MRRLAIPLVLAPALLAGCRAHRVTDPSGTLATLRDVQPDLEEAKVEQGLEEAMAGYRRFLDETPETAMTPEAMRRLADLQLEKQFGIHTGEAKPREMAAPETARVDLPQPALPGTGSRESDQDFEERASAESAIPEAAVSADVDAKGPMEAIALYDQLLTEYPNYEHKDQVLYQKARAYDELGRTEEAMETMERLIGANPHSEHFDEVQFRRGEYFFTRRKYREAENAYSAIIGLGTGSEYHELALYKLGWTFYKQDLYDEALHNYVALLDYKVSIGYDFDQAHAEEDERRVADTFRVISLSFSNLGGPDATREYFTTSGKRSYEDRIYENLGEHYLAKLRYDDAAKSFRTFVALYPFHRSAPRFDMRVVETFTQGGFPKLVLEAKRDFAAKYGLQAEYWRHFKPEESPEVVAYVKANLKDLASHYHAQYQGTEKPDEKLAHYREALRWYGDFLGSFPTDADSAPINYRMADLLLENKDFGEAARQYERTAYGYPAHPQSSAAGYAAVYAFREQLKVAGEDQREAVKRDTVASSLKFADAFPEHEHAAAILGAAADDLFEMKDYPAAVGIAQRVLGTYASRGARHPALRLDRRRARLLRARPVPASRAGLRRGAEAHGGGRRLPGGAGGQPRRLHLQAGRAGQGSAGSSCGGRSFPEDPLGGAHLHHPPHGRVRRGRRADGAPGLDGGGVGAGGVPHHLPGARAAARGHPADRARLPGERPADARRRRIRPALRRVRRSGGA